MLQKKRRYSWTQHQWIRLVAGSVVLLSLLLAQINPSWLLLYLWD